MSQCGRCKADGVARCLQCGGYFCLDHAKLDNHDCVGSRSPEDNIYNLRERSPSNE